ncbi:hypothetical protein RhiJN_28467 [Ceratobasidium sp. AG-Ba]|nr:hypothetical protein RhiJN_28467 [Ceratobasidium sp. AG-Ba]
MKLSIVAVSALSAVSSVAASRMHKRIDHPNARLTWFNLPSGKDQCGHTLAANAAAVHVPKAMWRNGENCGQWMEVNLNGKKSYGMVTGYCDGCQGNEIDLSPAMFEHYDNCDTGILNGASWKFMNKNWQPKDMDECD